MPGPAPARTVRAALENPQQLFSLTGRFSPCPAAPASFATLLRHFSSTWQLRAGCGTHLSLSAFSLKFSYIIGQSDSARHAGCNRRVLAAAVLFSPPGHVQPRCRHGVPNLGQPQRRSLPHVFGVALFTNVGQRLLEIRAAGSAFPAFAHIFLSVSLPSICTLPSFNLKQQQLFWVKFESPQKCRLWGTMERTSPFLLGCWLLRLKPRPNS